MHTTHNTLECHKYERISTAKWDFVRRNTPEPSCGPKTSHLSSSACIKLSAKIDQVKKSPQKLKYAQKNVSVIVKVTTMTQTHQKE